jgi:hypothetical protein
MQQVRRLPRIPGEVRARAERVPTPASAANGAPAARPGKAASRGGGRGRLRGPGPPHSLVRPLLRHHARRLLPRVSDLWAGYQVDALAWRTTKPARSKAAMAPRLRTTRRHRRRTAWIAAALL